MSGSLKRFGLQARYRAGFIRRPPNTDEHDFVQLPPPHHNHRCANLRTGRLALRAKRGLHRTKMPLAGARPHGPGHEIAQIILHQVRNKLRLMRDF
jgi:hypothetical protein